MTIDQAIATVRIALGDRDEHHPQCNSRATRYRVSGACDCYAAKRQVPHKALDVIEAAIAERVLTLEVEQWNTSHLTSGGTMKVGSSIQTRPMFPGLINARRFAMRLSRPLLKPDSGR